MDKEVVKEQIQKLRNDIDVLESQLEEKSMCELIRESYRQIPRGSIHEVKVSEFGNTNNPQWDIVLKPAIRDDGGIFSHEGLIKMLRELNLRIRGFESKQDGYLIITVSSI